MKDGVAGQTGTLLRKPSFEGHNLNEGNERFSLAVLEFVLNI